jgi:hypothetical protein
LFLHGHVCLLSDRKSEGRGDNDHERAAIHHAKILRLFGRHVERLEQAFREGASVAVVDVDEAGVHAVVKEITANGGKAKGIVADLREDANARRIVRETANAFGGLDFVRNHLGHPGPASVEGIEMADFALAVGLNLRSQIVATEAALPELRARGGGGLLYTVSTSGLVGSQASATAGPAASHAPLPAGMAACPDGSGRRAASCARPLRPLHHARHAHPQRQRHRSAGLTVGDRGHDALPKIQ